ncbi:pectate lyase [Wenyingzhuangia sp. chi5]|uniref:Pectate lyase n=1 Tax=Wenyingzhuangia gilva TaxID=3057677 RepID=A0ABT8VMW4_9FLAO|nr:pectate lyase [Wenyingzhuangia sp. chi5]MDO3693303.1 pectate lyase [Wenyingzhuangia sp. chi5]
MNKLKGLLLLLLGLFVFSACSTDSVEEEKDILVTKIIINAADITDGSITKLNVVVLPSNATNRAVTWSISDSSIALISETGIVNPLKNGTVTISATSDDGSEIVAEKTIKISGVAGPQIVVETINITGNDNISDGENKTYMAEVLPANASNKIISWSVSDTSIATITNQGILIPKKNGTVKVIASATDGSGIKGELSVTISGIFLTNLRAENMLLWQRSNGGWPKEPYNDFKGYDREQTEAEKTKALNEKNNTDTTIDNNHTIGEIRALLSAYVATDNINYLEAAERGIDYLFEAQYDNGGWPQYYPIRNNYSRRITYNDNAMGNVMNIMRDIFNKQNNFDVVKAEYAAKAKTAFDKGIQVILDTQVIVNGTKTAWCAQHDEVTLKPAMARDYELESNSGSESIGLIKLLMSLENPSPEVIDAIEKAVAWFDQVKIVGYALVEENGDKVLKESPGNVMWGRFYTLDDYTGNQYETLFNEFEPNQPFFCSRVKDSEGGGPRKTIAEISYERRNGYSWYGNWGKNLQSDYTKWKNANGL